MQFLEGDKNGSVAYYVDVRADISDWNIYLKRGATIDAPCVLHITKGTRLIWDKGTPVLIEVSVYNMVFTSRALHISPLRLTGQVVHR